MSADSSTRQPPSPPTESAPQIAVYANANAPQHKKTITLAKLHQSITDITAPLAGHTRKTRAVFHKEGKSENYDIMKSKCPAAMYAGYSDDGRRREDSPIQHSGYLLTELDPPPDSGVTADQLREAVALHPSAALVYISSSGLGIHAVMHVNPLPQSHAEHAEAWGAATAVVAAVVREWFPGIDGQWVNTDKSCKNRNRIAYLAHDPDARLRLETIPLPWTPAVKESPPPPSGGGGFRDGFREKAADLSAMAAIPCPRRTDDGGAYNEWLGWIRRFASIGISADEIAEWCKSGGARSCGKVQEIESHLRNTALDDEAQARNAIRGHAYNLGWRDAEAHQRQARNDGGRRTYAGATRDQAGQPLPPPDLADGDTTAPVTEILLSPATRPYFCVIGQRLHIADSYTGEWMAVGAGRSERVLAAGYALLNLLGQPSISATRLSDALRACTTVTTNPAGWGVAALNASEANRHPLVPLFDGGMLNLRYRTPLRMEDARALFSLRSESGSRARYDDIADRPHDWPPAAHTLAQHWGPRLLRRLAYMLLRPRKNIDVVNISVADWGKSTLAYLLSAALPDLVVTIHTGDATSSQARKFSSVTRYLATALLVILDEADKTDGRELTGDMLNGWADDTIRVERKGEDSQLLPRRGNVAMFGGGWPQLTIGQGSEARFNWAYFLDDADPLPKGIRSWCETPEAATWMLSYMAKLCAKVYQETDAEDNPFNDAEGNAAAARMIDECADPLISTLRKVFTRTTLNADPVSNAEITEALKDHGASDKEIPNGKAFSALVKTAFPTAQPKSWRSKTDGKNTRGYTGIALAE